MSLKSYFKTLKFFIVKHEQDTSHQAITEDLKLQKQGAMPH